MTNLQQFLRLRTSMILFVIAAGLISSPPLAHAQYNQADQSQCYSQTVDYEDDGYDGGSSNDVEQSACLYYDNQTGFDSWVETDNDYYDSFYSEYGYDNQITFGVGAEAQIYHWDSNYDNITGNRPPMQKLVLLHSLYLLTIYYKATTLKRISIIIGAAHQAACRLKWIFSPYRT